MGSRPCPLCDLEARVATDAEGALWSAISLGMSGMMASEIRAACCERHAAGAEAALERGVAHMQQIIKRGDPS